MDFSIIVPVNQVEKYAHHCMERIFKQGIDDNRFEVIILSPLRQKIFDYIEKTDEELFLQDRIDIIDFLKRQAPDLWFGNGSKQKLESYMY